MNPEQRGELLLTLATFGGLTAFAIVWHVLERRRNTKLYDHELALERIRSEGRLEYERGRRDALLERNDNAVGEPQ